MSLSFCQSAVTALVLSAGFGLFAPVRAAQAESEARHCGTRSHTSRGVPAVQAQGGLADCSAVLTRPDASYAEGGLYELKVVVHVIENADGSLGAISDEQIREQLRIVNDAFQAHTGLGPSSGVSFALATVDPNGAPSSGITRQRDAQWFADGGDYFEVLSWDPQRYINVYTNQAGGLLGYSFLPADSESAPGTPKDRVVLAFDRLGSSDDPSNQGHTLTHELGHYLGLDHTFAPNPTTPETFLCPPGDAPECYETGDLICDTPSEDAASEECVARSSCGTLAAIENYMNYSPDFCMDRFTAEQVLRMRCTVLAYRQNALWPAARLVTSEHPRQADLASYTLRLSNDSAETQRFSVGIASPDFTAYFADNGGTAIGATVETEALAPGETLDLDFAVELGDIANSNAAGSVELRASSDRNAQLATLPLSVPAVPASELNLETLNDAALGTPQTPAAFRVRVTNPGVLDDVYALALDSAWEATFATNNDSTLNLSLAAQTSAEVEIIVQVPPAAQVGEFASVVLDAEGGRAPAPRESVQLQAEADAYSRALLETVEPVPSVAPGGTQEIVVALRNAGNSATSYALLVNSRGPLLATLSADTVGPLAPFAEHSALVRVNMQADENAAATADAGVTIVARAVASVEESASLELPIAIAESGRVELVPRALQRELWAGEAATLTFTVENRSGNAERYELRVETESLLLEAPEPMLDVAATSNESFQLSVEKRTDETELTRIQISSVNDRNRSQSAVVTLLRPASNADAAADNASANTDDGDSSDDAGVIGFESVVDRDAAPRACDAGCDEAGAARQSGTDGCQCRVSSGASKARREGALYLLWLALCLALSRFRWKLRP